MGRHWLVLGVVAGGATLALAIACSGKTTGPGASACADFQAAIEPCVGGNFDGFQSYCESLLALPGVEPNAAADLETCAKSLSCTTLFTTGTTPPACNSFSVGTLGAGAGCVSSTQCQSSSCTFTAQGSSSSSGFSGSWGCGTCDTPIAVGQPCGGSTPTNADCVPPAECNVNEANGSGTCQVPDAGAADAALPPGETLVGMGASCTPNDIGGSLDGGIPTLMICEPPLTCGPSNTCIPITYAGASQPCDDNATQCAVGGCNITAAPTDGGSGTGTCPTVISNGQACDATSSTAVCDSFSSCIDGTCQTLNPEACASGG